MAFIVSLFFSSSIHFAAIPSADESLKSGHISLLNYWDQEMSKKSPILKDTFRLAWMQMEMNRRQKSADEISPENQLVWKAEGEIWRDENLVGALRKHKIQDLREFEVSLLHELLSNHKIYGNLTEVTRSIFRKIIFISNHKTMSLDAVRSLSSHKLKNLSLLEKCEIKALLYLKGELSLPDRFPVVCQDQSSPILQTARLIVADSHFKEGRWKKSLVEFEKSIRGFQDKKQVPESVWYRMGLLYELVKSYDDDRIRTAWRVKNSQLDLRYRRVGEKLFCSGLARTGSLELLKDILPRQQFKKTTLRNLKSCFARGDSQEQWAYYEMLKALKPQFKTETSQIMLWKTVLTMAAQNSKVPHREAVSFFAQLGRNDPRAHTQFWLVVGKIEGKEQISKFVRLFKKKALWTHEDDQIYRLLLKKLKKKQKIKSLARFENEKKLRSDSKKRLGRLDLSAYRQVPSLEFHPALPVDFVASFESQLKGVTTGE